MSSSVNHSVEGCWVKVDPLPLLVVMLYIVTELAAITLPAWQQRCSPVDLGALEKPRVDRTGL